MFALVVIAILGALSSGCGAALGINVYLQQPRLRAFLGVWTANSVVYLLLSPSFFQEGLPGDFLAGIWGIHAAAVSLVGSFAAAAWGEGSPRDAALAAFLACLFCSPFTCWVLILLTLI